MQSGRASAGRAVRAIRHNGKAAPGVVSAVGGRAVRVATVEYRVVPVPSVVELRHPAGIRVGVVVTSRHSPVDRGRRRHGTLLTTARARRKRHGGDHHQRQTSEFLHASSYP